MTARQTILARFKTLVEGIAAPNDFKLVEINRPDPIDTRKNPFPMALIYSGAELRDVEQYEVDHYKWNVVLEFWFKGVDVEEQLPIIHTAIWNDYMTALATPAVGSLEDLLNTLIRTETDSFDIDPTRHMSGLSITYQVDHSPEKGTV